MQSDIDKSEKSSKGQTILRGIDSIRGIAARMLEAQLVEQGIVGKPLAIQKLTKSYRVYYFKPWWSVGEKQLEYRLTCDTLLNTPEPFITYWTPATIPKEIWDLAYQQFSNRETLAANIEAYLLPQFDSLLDLFSYEQLHDATVQALLENGILMQLSEH